MRQLFRQLFTFVVVALLSVSILSQTVHAAITKISCNTAGVATGGFFDPDSVSTGGCAAADPKKFFSGLACHLIGILNKVFSNFYCALQFGMLDVLNAVAVLYIAVLGAKLLIGTQPPTLRATAPALLKIGALYMFATQGGYGVGIIYDFFIGVITDTVRWVIGGIDFCTPACTNLVDLFTNVDKKIYAMVEGTPNPTTPAIMEGGLFSEKYELVVFFLILAIIFLPLFQIAAYLLWMVISIIMNTLAGFMMSIIAIVFLISLSPIFLSFMLFNSTHALFNNWVKFLVSYSLQPLIIFAVFSLWILVSKQFVGFIEQLSNVMVSVNYNKEMGSVVTAKDSLKFCKLAYTETQPSIIYVTVPPSIFPGGISIKCCTVDQTSADPLQPVYVCNGGVSPNAESMQITYPSSLMSPSRLILESQFVYFLAYHLISFLVICYVFMQMIKIAPKMAQDLTGSGSSVPLGAGFGGGRGGLGSIVRQISGTGRDIVGAVGNKVANKVRPQINKQLSSLATQKYS